MASGDTYHAPAANIAQIDHHVHLGGPQLDLPLPGGESGERHHQQEWPVKLVVIEQVVQEADGLNGFSKAHLICKDAAVSPDLKGSTEQSELVPA